MAAYLATWNARPFVLGSSDCVTFTATWVDREIGTDYMQRVRTEFNYTSTLGALRTINGAGSFQALAEQMLGCPGTCAELLTTAPFELGDIALYLNGVGVQTFGVLGEKMIYGPDRWGVSASRLDRLTHYWRLSELRREMH